MRDRFSADLSLLQDHRSLVAVPRVEPAFDQNTDVINSLTGEFAC